MKMDCLLAGVGGQGTVLASRLIAQTAMEALGLAAHTSETIGMAQRGGSVTSQVRIGEGACAPAIPLGGAEFILGFEPAEALRNFPYLKEGGTVLVSRNPIRPVTSSLGSGYALEEILQYLQEKAGRCILVDGNALCAQAGSGKVLNVILLGAAVAEGLLPFSAAQLLAVLEKHVPAKFVELNRTAFEIGCNYKRQA
jgi:indolepyruvate ferredoxin oxidoreductase beta subunit